MLRSFVSVAASSQGAASHEQAVRDGARTFQLATINSSRRNTSGIQTMFRPLVLALLLAAAPSAYAYAPCPTGSSEMSVEGVNGIFCVPGSRICIDQTNDGSCPGPQTGLPNGSYCGIVASGVYGCKTNTTPAPPATTAPTPAPTMQAPATSAPAPVLTSAPAANNDDDSNVSHCPGGYEMSVEGAPGIFCVAQGPICIADRATGTCPDVQTGLPNGSHCGKVASGVFGCKSKSNTEGPALTTQGIGAPMSAPDSSTTSSAGPSTPMPTNGAQCQHGEFEMSVEGVRGIFCLANGPICMASITTGACPGPQLGLPYGSYCGKVASGIFGCKANDGTATATATAPLRSAATATQATAAPRIPAIVAPAPAPALAPAPAPAVSGICGAGSTPMSIEGVATIFCVNKPACVQQRSTGNCPDAQAGLPFGSQCDLIGSTGAYGCKPIFTAAAAGSTTLLRK